MPRPPMNVSFQLRGKEMTIRNLRRIRRQVLKRKSMTAWNAAQHLFSRTRAVVPYQDGDLYNAAYNRKKEDSDGRSVWHVGYDVRAAPHAWMVHDIQGRFHPVRGPSPEPKQDHYLSEPADMMRKSFPRTVRDDIQDEIRRVHIERLGRR